MAYLRDRRAFGNIGTRKFRGARFGDPLSPRGPQYTLEGRVLDYSTDVGPFTIVDQSGESNTATLYSGRGLTMDGVGDLIDFGSPTFSEPVTRMTGLARSTDTSINLGLTSATLAGNDTWETFSADTAAKDYGDAQWFNGTDTYVIKNIAGFRSSDSSGSVSATFITTATTSSTLFASCDVVNDASRFQFQLDSSGRVAFITRAGAFNAVRTLASFNDGQPHTTKLTSNGTSWQIEVDGVVEPIVVFAGSNNGWWFSDIPGRDNLTVGVSLYNIAGQFADASISEVIVADGASTPVLRYTGRGATPWVDTIGTNNGTVSGVDQTVTEYFTNPDFILGTGYNGDLSDVRCLGATGTVLGHWSLADWSDPTGDTSNGKVIVDSGPNQLHGTCTGCSGFTGEGIDPEVAGIVGLDDAQWFNGVDTFISAATPVFPATADFDETFEIYVGNLTAPASYLYYISQVATSNTLGLAISPTSGLMTFVVGGPVAIQAATSHYGEHITVRLTRVGTTFEMLINGVSEGTYVSSSSIDQVATVFGKNSALAGREVTGLIYGDSVTGTPSGTFVSVGQKRATIPQTADKNWNKGNSFDGTTGTFQDLGIRAIPATADFEISLNVNQRNGETASLKDIVSQYTGAVDGRFLVSCRNNKIRLFIGDSGGNVDLEGGNITNGAYHTVMVSRVGDLFTLVLDGLTIGSITASISIDQGTNTYVGDSTSASTRELLGTVSGLVAGVSTVAGTPQGNAGYQLVSASDANDQIDALGTAILEPRLNTQQINLFGEGEYSSTPDSASLDVTTTATWEIWGNFYETGTSRAYLAKYDTATTQRCWMIARTSSLLAGEMNIYTSADGSAFSVEKWTGLTDEVGCLSVTYAAGVIEVYWNASLLTLGSAAGTQASLFNSSTPVRIGDNENLNWWSDTKIGSAKIYNVALTAAEVLTNYETQKSLYGL